MVAHVRLDRRHARAAGVLGLLFLIVVLGGAATHVVARGETLGEIAQDHDVSVRELAELNGIANPDLILIGQVLQLPGSDDTVALPVEDFGTHTVVRGEVLSRIALDYGVSVRDLVSANSLDNPDLIPPALSIYLIPNANPDGLYAVTSRTGCLWATNGST